MPMLQVNVLTGYTDDIKQRLCQELTKTVSGVVDADPQGISVWVHEVPAQAYTRAGQVRQPGPAPLAHPRDQVLSYLAAMEARQLDEARGYLADSFSMTFPGGATFTDLGDLVEWSKDRYRFVKKTIASINVAYESDHIVVMCQGTLAGEWPDGSAFSNIRFTDRFELRSGMLTRQDVWNDLAYAQPS